MGYTDQETPKQRLPEENLKAFPQKDYEKTLSSLLVDCCLLTAGGPFFGKFTVPKGYGNQSSPKLYVCR